MKQVALRAFVEEVAEVAEVAEVVAVVAEAEEAVGRCESPL